MLSDESIRQPGPELLQYSIHSQTCCPSSGLQGTFPAQQDGVLLVSAGPRPMTKGTAKVREEGGDGISSPELCDQMEMKNEEPLGDCPPLTALHMDKASLGLLPTHRQFSLSVIGLLACHHYHTATSPSCRSGYGPPQPCSSTQGA